MEFTSLYSHGFARVAACTPSVALGEPDTNAERIVEQVRQCHDDGVALALFPELSVSGYSLDDLLLQDVLLDAVDAAIVKIAEETCAAISGETASPRAWCIAIRPCIAATEASGYTPVQSPAA